MLKDSTKILKINFFDKGGISSNMLFILFVVFIIVVMISVSFKSETTNIEIRKSEQKIFDLGMKSMSLKTDMMHLYKRSVIEKRVEGTGLETSKKLPYIIERN
jgi:cell division protein FtsL